MCEDGGGYEAAVFAEAGAAGDELCFGEALGDVFSYSL